LAGANLSNVIFAYANLSGNNLDGASLHRGNFQFSNLSGTDFTGVSSGLIQGATFIGADLSDTNFEGISFVVKDNNGLIQTSTNTFINMVHMVDSDCRLGDGTMKYCLESWKKIKKSKNAYAVVPLRIQVSGDDVTITFVPTFEFDEANLRGANLSGSDLTLGFLEMADLTNADLSNAILTGADLTDANLTGVILIEAVLNCKNHPICVN